MEVIIYDGETALVTATKPPIINGWRDDRSRLWHVSSISDSSKTMHKRPHQEPQSTKESTDSVYALPSINQIVGYYHAAERYPTKPTWIEAIPKICHASWALLSERAMNKYFPEAMKMFKKHMPSNHKEANQQKKNENLSPVNR